MPNYDDSYFYDRKPLVDKNNDVIDFHPSWTLTEAQKEIYIKARAEKRFWTVVTGDDGRLYLLTGFHFINVFAQFITEIPWDKEDLEIPWDFDEEEKDDDTN